MFWPLELHEMMIICDIIMKPLLKSELIEVNIRGDTTAAVPIRTSVSKCVSSVCKSVSSVCKSVSSVCKSVSRPSVSSRVHTMLSTVVSVVRLTKSMNGHMI